MPPKAAPKKKKQTLTPAQRVERRQQRALKREVHSIFAALGFSRLEGVEGKEITVKGTTSEFDDGFLYQNVIVLFENTVHAEDKISGHLKHKSLFYTKLLSNSSLISVLTNAYPKLDEYIAAEPFDSPHYFVSIVYCARNDLVLTRKSTVSEIHYFSAPVRQYFKTISAAIHLSARNELLEFLQIDPRRVGPAALKGAVTAHDVFPCTVLPETNSNLGKGFKVVSFYVAPSALLSRFYVLRRRGWRDSDFPYQRVVQKKRVSSIRDYLRSNNKAFLNNVILTLHHDTKIVDEDGDTVSPSDIDIATQANVQLPLLSNSIGVIDGQHRILAYHEGGPHDKAIAKLRDRLNLLATGIIYPKGFSEIDRVSFEAQLFLEINANHLDVRSDLIQSIQVLISPYSEMAVARRVLMRLNSGGSLKNRFAIDFEDSRRLKTSSIVSYGIRNIVKYGGDDSLFSLWKNPEKLNIVEAEAGAPVDAYVDYAATHLSMFFSAASQNVDAKLWTSDSSVEGRILTTTSINGLIVCLRLIIENDGLRGFSEYSEAMQGLDAFEFDAYKSSQYGAMGRDLYKDFFQGKL